MKLTRAVRTVDQALRGEARRILVDSRTPVNYAMVLPVVQAMAVDPRVRFYFTASEEPERMEQIYAEAEPGTKLVGPLRAALMRWDAYLTSDFMWATLPRGTARIQMFHGVAGKYGFDAPTESMRQWDRLFFVNERRLRNFLRAGAIDAGSSAAQLIGMPKVDALVNGSIRADDVRRELGLDPSLPTVLYAPTWSPASSLNRMGVQLLEALLALPINVVVKLHDRSRDARPQYSGGVDWPARLTEVLERPAHRGRGVLAGMANIAPCLVAADVMITDHSSAGFEYLLLDRPLVRIEIPELLKQANIHPDYVQLLADASINVLDHVAAADAVQRAIADPSERSASRRRVAGELFYGPGTATARCAAALYDVLQLTPHTSFRPEPACLQSA